MKTRMKKMFLLFLAMALILGSFVGCGSKTESQTATETTTTTTTATQAPSSTKVEQAPATTTTEAEPAKADYLDKTVTLGMMSTWGLLCPYASTDSYSQFVYEVLYERLVLLNGDYTISPRAADSWETNKESTVWTFHLNHNLKWHDGTPLTAEDWVFAAQAVTNPGFVTAHKSAYSSFTGTDNDGNETSEKSVGWEAVDDYTLRMTLKAPADLTSYFVSNNIRIFPMPKHLLSGIDTAALMNDPYWQNPVGCGVGIFKNQVEGSTITFETNQDYYRGAPKFGTLVMRVVAQDSIPASFISGEIDLCFNGIPPEDAMKTAEHPNVEYAPTSVATTLTCMALNVDRLNDKRLRQAVRYCVDQRTIGQVLYSGENFISASPTVPSGEYYTDTIEYATEYNPEKAKQLLIDAGWDFNDTMILGSPSGNREKAAAMIEQSLESIGVKCEIRVGDASTVFANGKNGEYHMYIISFSTWTNNPLTVQNSLKSYWPQIINHAELQDLYGLLDKMSAEMDQAKRVEYAHEWLELFTDECPLVTVYRTKQYMMTSSRVKGWDPDRQAVGYNNNYQDLVVD